MPLSYIRYDSYNNVFLLLYVYTFPSHILRDLLMNDRAPQSMHSGACVQIDSPFVMKVYCVFETETKLYVILDWCAGGELFFHLQKAKHFDLQRTRFYGYMGAGPPFLLLYAISLLHSKKKG